MEGNMSRTEQLVTTVTEAVIRHFLQNGTVAATVGLQEIPAGVSNRHIHLSQSDFLQLFGTGAQLMKQKDLSQPGQFACTQTVTLVGPDAVIERVRILGPVRGQTQVEISAADGFRLGVKAPVRDSGDLCGSAGITMVGPAGAVALTEGVIIAARHLHIHSVDAVRFGIRDGEKVSAKISGPRGMILNEILARVGDGYALELHVDIDEANAAGLQNGDCVEIIKA